MNWVMLTCAGLLEIVWAVSLKQSAGFTRLLPSLITVVAMVASFYLLSLAVRSLPLGTAYAAWVGIGAVGTALAGWLFLQESMTWPKLASLVLVVIGIAGLKLAGTT